MKNIKENSGFKRKKREQASNFVLHAKSPQFHWEGTGQLSIKTFSNGNAYYKTNQGYFAVESSRYLLLNAGDYTISIDDTSEVESFCLFFKDGFAEEVFRSLDENMNDLLSDPYKPCESIGFFEKTYEMNDQLATQLHYFKSHLTNHEADSIWREEQYLSIMQTLLSVHKSTLKDAESVQALRRSTQIELYKRISIAHDYIRSCYRQPIKLEDIAHVACLSTNHLLRHYSQLYGKTPHQYISELRIQKAKQLLKHSDQNMTHIAFELGFNHSVSFSKMFKQHVGISPLQYRKKVRLAKK